MRSCSLVAANLKTIYPYLEHLMRSCSRDAAAAATGWEETACPYLEHLVRSCSSDAAAAATG